MNGNEQESEIASLRELICKTFPAEKFEGMITHADGEFTEELDEEKDLYETLRNVKWPDVAPSFIHSNPDGYALLTDAAYAAFLPAWLIQSLEATNKNTVREFLIYSFDPDTHATTLPQIISRFQQFSSLQRKTVQSVVKHLAKYEPSKFIRENAERAVAFIGHLNQQ